MTRLLLSLTLLVQIGFAQGQRGVEPPTSLVISFERSYQQASDLNWVERPGGGFIAEFEWESFDTEAHYNEYGEWIFTENFISRTDLPQTAQIHVRRTLGSQNPDKIGHHNARQGDYFFVRLRSREWRYDKQGNFIGAF